MTYTEVKMSIDQLIQQAKEKGNLTSEQLKQLNNKFRLEWNYNSNSMEGNTLTIAETRSVMIGNLDVHRKPMKDVLEVKGHDEIIRDILRIGKAELRLSEARIKAIHTGIMYEDDVTKRTFIGQWKTEPNEIINYRNEKYSFVAPEEVPTQLHELLNRTNAAIDQIERRHKNAPHPLDVALNFHIDYLNIHPFYDGNGRTARILSNLILVALGYPPFWIANQERKVYYNYIADIQCYGGRKEDLFAFLGELILRSQQMILAVQAGESIEEADDVDKEIELLKRELKMKEELEKSINWEDILAGWYANTVRPLFEGMTVKVKKFDDLFDKIEIDTYIETKDESLEVEDFANIDSLKLKSIQSFEMYISLVGLKLLHSKEDLNLDLSIVNNSTSYTIHCNNEVLFEQEYDQVVSKDKINELIKWGMERIIEDIKNAKANE